MEIVLRDSAFVNIFLGVVAGLIVLWIVAIWRKVTSPRVVRQRQQISSGRKRIAKRAEAKNVVLECEVGDCHSCLKCAAGCLILLSLDQYREAADVKHYGFPHESWGWGDSVPRHLGIKLSYEIETSPERQPSPTFTSLSLETLADIWPNLADMGLGSPFAPMPMGLHYLLNRETADGRIDWAKWVGAITAHEITGTIRHSALGASALLKYAAKSPELRERARTAVGFVVDELDGAPWSRIEPPELVPVSMGAVRRALWSFAESKIIDNEMRQLCIRAIGAHDAKMTLFINTLVTGMGANDWVTRSSWATLRDPEAYPGLAMGPNSMPMGVMAFLLWSPTNDDDAITALERVVELAIRRNSGNGITLFGYPAPDLRSNIAILSLIISSAPDGKWPPKLGKKFADIASKLRKATVENFWDHEQQKRMSLLDWMWLLRSLMGCRQVQDMLTRIDAKSLDQEVDLLRNGKPHLYYPIKKRTLQRVCDIADKILPNDSDGDD